MEGRGPVVLPLRPSSMIARPFDCELWEYLRMRLIQKDLDRLTVFTLAELARRRLNLPEAMANSRGGKARAAQGEASHEARGRRSVKNTAVPSGAESARLNETLGCAPVRLQCAPVSEKRDRA